MVLNSIVEYNDFMQPKNYTPIDKLIAHYKSTLASSFSKETEPPSSEEVEYQRLVEHEPSEEVQKYVEHRKETVEVSPELKDLGVEARGEAAFQKTEEVKLPLTDEKIEEGLHQPIISSWRWLAELALYILKQAHLTLKKVHGHIRRVVYA